MSWPRPSAKAAIHDSGVLAGNAIDSKNPAGVAPFAARSERFIRSALRAMLCGGSPGRKCTPAITPSVVNQIATGRRRERGRIVAETERARSRGQWFEVALNETLFA